ncbi:FAD-dependent monooxygenase [Streptomyces erythrochromogenes]|uniref:NAD(P)/FAD-dependent oxidoreductase n=1 Tax=Streptomyces erythrochromogenes TaxID=285574 RepID=UPI00341FF18D
MTTHRPTRRALILGGGLAGTLAAAALAPHCTSVVIIERHALPEEPEPRRGLPQARHAHMLWSGGADAIEYLLPGTTARWLTAGARRIPLPNGMVSLSPGGWYRRWSETHYLIGASRDLIDWGVRAELQADPKVSIRVGSEPIRLLGNASRITGAVIRNSDDTEETLDTDLVIDAMGRSSRATRWLGELGVPTVPETTIDAGVTYASRRYKAPAGTETWPVINIQADARLRSPGKVASIIPIERGEWMVSLSGTRGGEPTSDEALFEDFASEARSPLVAQYLRHAQPLGLVTVNRNTANRRRHFEKVRLEGFIAIGDAATALNPVYGHGMSVAAQSARALRDLAARTGDIAARGFARRAQRAIGRPASAAWLLAAGQDIYFPDSLGKTPNLGDRIASAYIHRLIRTACGDFNVAKALTDVMTLQGGATVLGHPRVLLAAVRGPRLPALNGPALTPNEEAVKLGRPRKTASHQAEA